MLQRLFPGRVADRLILRVTGLLDALDGPSAFATGVIIDWLDSIAADEGFSAPAVDGMRYAILAGYAARVVEEAEGTARALEHEVLARLDRVRAAAPELREQLFEEALADPTASDFDRDYLRQLHEAGDELPYHGEREVLDALIADDTPERWFTGERFLRLSGLGQDVWRIFALKLTTVVNQQLAGEERRFPWEAIQEAVRFGYVLRVGDALNEIIEID